MFAATSAAKPAPSDSCNLPSTSDPLMNAKDMIASVTAIPMEPINNSGLRPSRSIRAIATRTDAIEMAPLRILILRASDSLNPTACHKTAP